MRCGFSLESVQPETAETGVLINNLRYLSTEVYTAKCFNDYLFFCLKRGIKKKILVNAQSSSSWRFRRFIYLLLKSKVGVIEH